MRNSFRFAQAANDGEGVELLGAKIKDLETKAAKIPFLDPIDERFRARVEVPVPDKRAVMFHLMDVSGSMGEQEKTAAKTFFLMLDLFLKKRHQKIEHVFIRYHERANDCTEHEFLYGRESGGTHVSSALIRMKELIAEKYPPSSWNIYGALASDGDMGGPSDVMEMRSTFPEILECCQYFAYLEIANKEKSLSPVLDVASGKRKNFARTRTADSSGVHAALTRLFKRKDSSMSPGQDSRMAAFGMPAYL